MADQITRIRVFVASPGDVKAEREKLQHVIDGLNETMGRERGAFIELVRWETHVHPDMGRPQQVVADQIGPYDVFVGMMWKRFGTPTGVAESGTEEEFRDAYNRWESDHKPRIMFYFCQRPFMPRKQEELSQCSRVLEFRKEISRAGITREYVEPDDFADKVRTALYSVIAKLIPYQTVEVEGSTTSLEQPRPDQYIFQENFEDFAGWEQLGTGSVEQTEEVVRSGRYALKKDRASDPNGGYKLIGKTIKLGFVFSGWLFHPSDRGGGAADRLAIEDSNFNGYGFCLTDSCTRMWIERRDNKKATVISEQRTTSLEADTWYRFSFYITSGGVLSIRISDELGKELERIEGVEDGRFSSFDRVVVHGGYHYYIDELRISEIDASSE